MPTRTLSRREVLGCAAGAAAASRLDGAEEGKRDGPGFLHRGYLGWITDLATNPDPAAEWPSMRLDEQLLKDYAQTFRLMPRLGYNEATIWGLYVSRAWPVEVRNAVPAARGKMVERLLDLAHASGIRIYTGLGVYSWGFDEIIRANPKLSRGNPHAMCASVPESWNWMQRVTDYVFKRFPIDGASLQSADQGRCSCEDCRRYTNAEYHARLNIKVGEYIRDRWPGKTVAINGWGMNFADPKTFDPLARMSRAADYIIDVSDSSSAQGPGARQRLAQGLKCDFGTIGGPQVEPPQHWERNRWFLPTPRGQGEHLAALYRDGGRACEYFFHILANPGDEISFWVAGKLLRDPATDWRQHLRSTIEELYGTTKRQAVDDFMSVISTAEEAYMRYLPSLRSGTISMEPLVSSKPGPPVYLTRKLDAAQRAQYGRTLEGLATRFSSLAPDIPDKTRAQTVLACMRHAVADAKSTAGA